MQSSAQRTAGPDGTSTGATGAVQVHMHLNISVDSCFYVQGIVFVCLCACTHVQTTHQVYPNPSPIPSACMYVVYLYTHILCMWNADVSMCIHNVICFDVCTWLYTHIYTSSNILVHVHRDFSLEGTGVVSLAFKKPLSSSSSAPSA